MCSNAGVFDHSKALYERAGNEIATFLVEIVKPDMRSYIITSTADELLLARFARNWINFKIFIKWIQKLFRHLDNGYVANSSIPSISSVGLKSFHSIIFSECKARVTESIMNMLDRERDGFTVEAHVLKACIEVFALMGRTKMVDLKSIDTDTLVYYADPDLKAYHEDFEVNLLRRTSAYYARKSACLMAIEDTAAYLLSAEHALEAETLRARRYCHRSSELKIIHACERELLQKHQMVLVERDQTGLASLLRRQRLDDISRMFRLFKSIPGGINHMTEALKNYARKKGRELPKLCRTTPRSCTKKSAGSRLETIENLIALHQEMNHVVEHIFTSEPRFRCALKEVMVEIVNIDVDGASSNVELLVAHADHILSGRVKMAEQDMEQSLEQAADLFSLMSDKDQFVELYRNQLAKRLLSNKSVSIHMEEAMIVKMKSLQGTPFTSKLEGMLNDYHRCEIRSSKTCQLLNCRSGLGACVERLYLQVHD